MSRIVPDMALTPSSYDPALGLMASIPTGWLRHAVKRTVEPSAMSTIQANRGRQLLVAPCSLAGPEGLR